MGATIAGLQSTMDTEHRLPGKVPYLSCVCPRRVFNILSGHQPAGMQTQPSSLRIEYALEALPSIPRVMALVLSELNAEEPDLRTIGRLLKEDPLITVRVLAFANSARFNLSQGVTTVAEALPLLGLEELRDIVCVAAVASAFRQVGGIHMELFWRYSLNTAKLARALAASTPFAAPAYTAGLLHATGELVLHRSMPQVMAELDAAVPVFDLQRAAAERQRLGYSYAEVGAAFVRSWGLPDRLAQALAQHAGPDVHNASEPLAGFVHVAAWRARMEERNQGLESMVATFPQVVTSALDIDSRVVLDDQSIHWTSRQEVVGLL